MIHFKNVVARSWLMEDGVVIERRRVGSKVLYCTILEGRGLTLFSPRKGAIGRLEYPSGKVKKSGGNPL